MKKRLFSFALLYSVLVLSLGVYIGARVATSEWHWYLLASMAVLLLLLPTSHWKSDGAVLKVVRVWLQQGTFFAVGFMSWLLVAVVARDLILVCGQLLPQGLQGGVTTFREMSGGSRALGFALGLSLVGVIWAIWGARVRKLSLVIDGLPESLNGFSIVQISDLHIGPTIGAHYVDKVVSKVNALKPDVVALTGDIVDGSIDDFSAVASRLSGLGPRGRVFYVPGNHEYYWEYEAWLEAFRSWGLKVLLNQGETLSEKEPSVWIGGVVDPMGALLGQAPDVSAAFRGGENSAFKLLLAHRPDPAAEAAATGFDLQISGHTHGGQFFPWTYVAKFFHKHYLGLEKEGRMWIYVSPGTGWWGPPMRLGTTPEITRLELRSTSKI